MGGDLKLESELDKGSEFYFDLKLKKVLSSKKSISDKLAKINICVYESNSIQSREIIRQLHAFKISYELFDADSIHKLYQSKECNLLILNNKEVVKKLLKSEINENLKIILIHDDANEFRELNFITVLDTYMECPSQLYNVLSSQQLFDEHYKIKNKAKTFKLKILIAEDYEVNRILIEELLLSYKDIDFTFALNGQEVIDIIKKENNFDLILMDINMPIMDGLDATKNLRIMHVTTPIIALTANALQGDKERFLDAGMDEYISKPIEVTELERILEKYSAPKLTNNTIETPKNTTYTFSLEEVIAKTMKRTRFPEKIVLKLMNSYLKNSQVLMDTFIQGIRENNFEKISRSTHDLKSSAQTFHFIEIGELMTQAERSANKKEEYDFIYVYNLAKEHYIQLTLALSQKDEE